MRKVLCHLAAVLWLLSFPLCAQEKPYKYARMGSPIEVVTKTTAGVMLMGGGKDQDPAFQWMCRKSGGGDFLVIRASGTDAYNPYINQICRINSVATLIIPSRAAANDPFVAETINKAEAIFIAGGDQANYVNFWKGTPVQAALNDAIVKGIPVGGSSAGLAVLGELVFAALKDTAYSKVVLPNPYDPTVTLERGFLNIPILKGVITDTHFVARDRLGRLIAFMARIVQDGWEKQVRGIGIDERTAVGVEPDGRASMFGEGAAYFLRSTEPPSRCRPGEPLTVRGIDVYKTSGSATFNLATWSGSGGASYRLSVERGVVQSTQPAWALY